MPKIVDLSMEKQMLESGSLTLEEVRVLVAIAVENALQLELRPVAMESLILMAEVAQSATHEEALLVCMESLEKMTY
jgi:hypothetical protein